MDRRVYSRAFDGCADDIYVVRQPFGYGGIPVDEGIAPECRVLIPWICDVNSYRSVSQIGNREIFGVECERVGNFANR